METSKPNDDALFVLLRQGPQPKLDIVAIAAELARLQCGGAALRILFEWSQLSAWPFEAPSAAAIKTWNAAVPPLSRVAISTIRNGPDTPRLLRPPPACRRSFSNSSLGIHLSGRLAKAYEADFDRSALIAKCLHEALDERAPGAAGVAGRATGL